LGYRQPLLGDWHEQIGVGVAGDPPKELGWTKSRLMYRKRGLREG
jgi:hypothetical protein